MSRVWALLLALCAAATARDRPPAFGSMAIESAVLGSINAIRIAAVALMLRSSVPETLWRPPPGGFWLRASSAFSGGIVEETLARWGLMTALIALEGAMVAHGAADVWLQAALPALLA